MKQFITMNLLSPGTKAEIQSVSGNREFKRRIQDLGLIKGTVISCLHKSPLGDPIAYLVRGSVIALRNGDSKRISTKILSYKEE